MSNEHRMKYSKTTDIKIFSFRC